MVTCTCSHDLLIENLSAAIILLLYYFIITITITIITITIIVVTTTITTTSYFYYYKIIYIDRYNVITHFSSNNTSLITISCWLTPLLLLLLLVTYLI